MKPQQSISPRRHSAPFKSQNNPLQSSCSGSIPSRFEPNVPESNRQEGFNSSAPRFGSSKTPVPGPGSYSIQNQHNPSISSKGYGYGIVSKEKRFMDAPKPTFNTPGPGEYDITNFVSKPGCIGLSPQFKVPTSYSIQNPKLGRNDQRSSHKIMKSDSPGPGQYSISNKEVEKESVSYGVFKSHSRRLFETGEKIEPVLTQSHALLRNTKSFQQKPNIKEVFIRYDEKLPSASFRSTADKHLLDTELKRISRIKPHPNASPDRIKRNEKKYEVRQRVLEAYDSAPSSVFANAERIDRFGNLFHPKLKKEVTPGPGEYNPMEVDKRGFKKSQSLLISSSFFLSDTNRFRRSNIAGDMYIVTATDQLSPTTYDIRNSNPPKKSFHRNVNQSWL